MATIKKTISLSRKQLYDEIWNISVSGVARKYNLNYQKLIAKCKESNIPFPPSGYWTRKEMGKDVTGEVVLLEEPYNENVELLLAGERLKKNKPSVENKDKKQILDISNTCSEETTEKQINVNGIVLENLSESEKFNTYETMLTFMDADEKERVLNAALKIAVIDKRRLHKKLIEYRDLMTEWKRNQREESARNIYNNKLKSEEPTFFNEISLESQKRAFLILDAIFCAVEELGGEINSDLSIRIKSDILRIRIAESKDKIPHELTKQEAKELVEYNDRVKRKLWASKPNIRKYDYVYNGKLRIVLDDGGYIKDSTNEKVEDRLGDVLIRIYENYNEVRIEREKRETEQRRREEEAKRREELRKRKEDEIRRTNELVNEAEDYRIACEIRQYISAVALKKKSTAEIDEWIEWAKNKADWYDPTVAFTDEYLGQREHSKSKEEKELGNKSKDTYRFWGW